MIIIRRIGIIKTRTSEAGAVHGECPAPQISLILTVSLLWSVCSVDHPITTACWTKFPAKSNGGKALEGWFDPRPWTLSMMQGREKLSTKPWKKISTIWKNTHPIWITIDWWYLDYVWNNGIFFAWWYNDMQIQISNSKAPRIWHWKTESKPKTKDISIGKTTISLV